MVPEARATTFTVPTDGTVNEVIDQAGTLDLVLIEPGTYTVTELNPAPALTIMATGPGVVLQAGSPLLLRVDDDLALDGLELDGLDNQIAFVTDDATLTMQDCTLRNGIATQGAHVQLQSGSGLQATSTAFLDGRAVTSGGSIASNGGTIQCVNCLFQNNVVDGPSHRLRSGRPDARGRRLRRLRSHGVPRGRRAAGRHRPELRRTGRPGAWSVRLRRCSTPRIARCDRPDRGDRPLDAPPTWVR